MRRRDLDRLEDVADAILTIRAHLAEGALRDGTVFDAVLYRLIVIGEAVKAITPALLAEEPDIDWSAAAQFRDRLAHRYWDTMHAVVEHVVRYDLDPMAAAVARLRTRHAPRD